MNYTKGEWKVGHYIVYSDTPSMEFQSLICNTDIGISSETEKTANAHLIASAPAMYEALKYIRQNLAKGDVAGFMSAINKGQIKIDKALAKAEGKDEQ